MIFQLFARTEDWSNGELKQVKASLSLVDVIFSDEQKTLMFGLNLSFN